MKTNKSLQKEILNFIIMSLGTLVTAFALNTMVIPSLLLSGGVTGIAQLINVAIPINVGVFYFILNVPILILGYVHLGRKFVLYSIYGVIELTVLLAYIPKESMFTEDIMLNALFGGMFVALGAGVVLRAGGSQGGMDIVSRVIASKKDISIGKIGLLINAVIILFSSFIFGFEISMYTIISMIISMIIYDMILNHVNRVSLLVITDREDIVINKINETFMRGTTIWDAHGGYTKQKKSVIYCVITNSQLSQFKKAVKEVDEKAFITVIETRSVIGKFQKVW